MWLYQNHGPAAAGMELELESDGASWLPRLRKVPEGLAPLVANRVIHPTTNGVQFSSEEWFYFFCAVGLLYALRAGDQAAVQRRRYINPVHQYLQALLVGAARTDIVPVLRRWVLNTNGSAAGQPIARDFAAYVLGMAGAIEAHEDLAHVIVHDPDEEVRSYCIASLGRMRARVQLPLLVRLYERAQSEDMRLLIAQAISRMVGVADYPL